MKKKRSTNITWKRIIDEEPEKMQYFWGAYITGRGYRADLCYRDDEGNYHDVVEELRFRLFASGNDPVMSQFGIAPPKWAEKYKDADLRMSIPPDWWMELPPVDHLQVYIGSPADKFMAKELAAIKDQEMLQDIEQQMNDIDIDE